MRTTVDIDASVIKSAKHRALVRGSTLSEIVQEALRSYLAQTEEAAHEPFELITRGRPGSRFPSPREMAELLAEEEAHRVG